MSRIDIPFFSFFWVVTSYIEEANVQQLQSNRPHGYRQFSPVNILMEAIMLDKSSRKYILA